MSLQEKRTNRFSGISMSELMTRKPQNQFADVKGLSKEGLRNLGFDIPSGKITARQAVMLNEMEKELPSASDVAKADDIELQEIMENSMESMKDLIAQFEGQETLPMRELLGLDKQLRGIRG